MTNKEKIGRALMEALPIFITLITRVATLGLLIAYPFMWIWNYVMVEALTVTGPISYWEAYWLFCIFALFLSSEKVLTSS